MTYIDEVFGDGGHLAQRFADYEKRDGQIDLARVVDSVITEGGQAAVEAGCGAGKTLIYCVPVIYQIAKRRSEGELPKTTVIVTQNITLQEQIVKKDLPMLAQALPIPFTYALFKGRGNFLCRKKVDEHERSWFEDAENAEEIFDKKKRRRSKGYTFGGLERKWLPQAQDLMDWASVTQTGDPNDGSLQFVPERAVWYRFASDRNDCRGRRCRYYEACHYQRHRNKAIVSDIIVTNYHMLLAHFTLLAKSEKEDSESGEAKGVLPAIDTLICDEAHELEHIARDVLGFSINLYSFLPAVRLVSDRRQQLGPHRANAIHEGLTTARDQLLMAARDHLDASQVANKMPRGYCEVDADKNVLFHGKPKEGPDWLQVEKPNEAIETIYKVTGRRELPQPFMVQVAQAIVRLHERRLREGGKVYLPRCLKDPALLDPQPVLGYLEELSSALNDIILTHEQAREHGGDPGAHHQLELQEAKTTKRQLDDLAEQLREFCQQTDPNKAYWIDVEKGQTQLRSAVIDVSVPLQEMVYPHVRTLILTSATLTTNHNFGYLTNTLGLTRPKTRIMQSPFNYYDQAIIAVPTREEVGSDPNTYEFDRDTAKVFRNVIETCKGRTLGLFTRIESMNRIAKFLKEDTSYRILVQGQMDRNQLITAFRDDVSSVLLGVKSFWQGIDVPGEALTAVVIHKLPFPVPDDPIVESITERLGRYAWQLFSLPRMLLEMRQGIGRLIRRKDDVGVIVILDRRVAEKDYGDNLAKSLPRMGIWIGLSGIGEWLKNAQNKLQKRIGTEKWQRQLAEKAKAEAEARTATKAEAETKKLIESMLVIEAKAASEAVPAGSGKGPTSPSDKTPPSL